VLRLSRRLRQQAIGDITPSQLSALASIAKHGELSLGSLASIERVAPPSMTRIAATLESQGLVLRRSDDVDRRVARVAISDSGRAVLDEIRNRRDAYLAVRIRDLSDEDRELLSKAIPILERLAEETVGLDVESVPT
jgi:DNA-binding MarR family transcriptional regulator